MRLKYVYVGGVRVRRRYRQRQAILVQFRTHTRCQCHYPGRYVWEHDKRMIPTWYGRLCYRWAKLRRRVCR